MDLLFGELAIPQIDRQKMRKTNGFEKPWDLKTNHHKATFQQLDSQNILERPKKMAARSWLQTMLIFLGPDQVMAKLPHDQSFYVGMSKEVPSGYD